MKLENQTIIIISNEPWGEIWYSKHHYANELSKSNIVFFINSPVKWEFKNLLLNNPEVTLISPNLYEISYPNVLPLTGISNIAYFINNWLVCKKLKKMLRKYNVQNPIFWSFDPYRLLNPKHFNPAISIYHNMDLHTQNREKWLVKNVDVVLTVSKKLSDNYVDIKRPIFVIPHGIPDVNQNAKKIISIKTENTILLIGTISHRIDFELLYKIAYRFNNYKLKIFGAIFSKEFTKDDHLYFEKLKQLSNVKFYGAIPFQELTKEIAQCRLAICTYKNDSGNQINSLKIKQYLCFGKNTVSTYMLELQEAVQQGLLQMTNEHEVFLDMCEAALITLPPFEEVQKRIDYTKEFLYSKLLKQIENIIKNHIHETKKPF